LLSFDVRDSVYAFIMFTKECHWPLSLGTEILCIFCATLSQLVSRIMWIQSIFQATSISST